MKNPDKKQHRPEDKKNFQNPDKDPRSEAPEGNPYNSENLNHETGSASKDITEKDIEKDLIQNDCSEGFETDIETDIETENSDEAQSDTFVTIEPHEDNPVSREFEIEQLGNQELQQDERARDESGNGAPGHDKPSQQKF